MKLGKLSVETENPSEYIRQILSEYKSPKFDYLPSFTGGLVGVIFRMIIWATRRKSIRGKARDTEDFKDVDLMLFDKVIAFDNLCQKDNTNRKYVMMLRKQATTKRLLS